MVFVTLIWQFRLLVSKQGQLALKQVPNNILNCTKIQVIIYIHQYICTYDNEIVSSVAETWRILSRKIIEYWHLCLAECAIFYKTILQKQYFHLPTTSLSLFIIRRNRAFLFLFLTREILFYNEHRIKYALIFFGYQHYSRSRRLFLSE